MENKYEWSQFEQPMPGIAIGCITPEANDLLDTIMEKWEEHYKGLKEAHGFEYEPTFYGFAYWLCRWSGLIQPTQQAPTGAGLPPLPEPILTNDDVKYLDVKDGGLKMQGIEEQANAIYQKYCTDNNLVYHLLDAANFCLGYMAAKAPTGAVWVKASVRLPANNNLVHINFSTGKTDFKLTGYYEPSEGEWYKTDGTILEWAPNLEWLDESGADDWVSVNERLPYRDGDDSIFCVVIDTCEGIVVRPFNEAHVCWDLEDGSDYYTDAKGGKITHWRPLPEPPKSK